MSCMDLAGLADCRRAQTFALWHICDLRLMNSNTLARSPDEWMRATSSGFFSRIHFAYEIQLTVRKLSTN